MANRYHFSDEQKQTMAAMREAGKSFAQIARRFGCGTDVARHHCMTLGADDPKGHLRPPSKVPAITYRNGVAVRRFTPIEDEILRAMRARGASYAEMRRRLGRAPSSIRNRLLALAHEDLRAEARQHKETQQ